MDRISTGIAAASNQLGVDETHLIAAARGMMTTDTQHKISSRQVSCNGHNVQVTGMAKGAGMIGPRMATMLAVIMTDAAVACDDAQRLLSETVDTTFNCISVEGHTSTNDTVLLLASGAADGTPLGAADLETFQSTVHEVCVDLARAIPADGEGATHLIEIEVSGCASSEAARSIARTVANSLLVKTAVAGADPNWGRIVSAVGFAEVPFDPRGLNVSINGTTVYRDGAPVGFDAAKLSSSIRDSHDTSIAIKLSDGDGCNRFWTSDLTARYVQINADYRT
jgi:glutamate N-acetyltransferase/amino-acid N-acetyltransferase